MRSAPALIRVLCPVGARAGEQGLVSTGANIMAELLTVVFNRIATLEKNQV